MESNHRLDIFCHTTFRCSRSGSAQPAPKIVLQFSCAMIEIDKQAKAELHHNQGGEEPKEVQAALNVSVNRPAQSEMNVSIAYLQKEGGAGSLPHTPQGIAYLAAPLALRKNLKPRAMIPAPTNRVSSGLAVIRSQVTPMAEVIPVPASEIRLATVTVSVVKIPPLQNDGLLSCLAAGCGNRNRTCGSGRRDRYVTTTLPRDMSHNCRRQAPAAPAKVYYIIRNLKPRCES